MLDSIFTGLFDSALPSFLSVRNFLICVATALVLGLLTATAYRFKCDSTRSFTMTLAILPALVTVVIMMVNGNLGAGVAVAGAFSLVKFRSAAGSAREIAAIFLAMSTGLITGMGYIVYAAIYTVLMCVTFVIYTASGFGNMKVGNERTLRITIPEDLDYTGVFDEIFGLFTSKATLTTVKTTNMGSMFKLRYDVILKDSTNEKEFIDRLRERNGNLEISLSIGEASPVEL